MALLIYYNQIENSPDEVTYQFGETRDHLDRTLTIDKANNAPRTDQPEDVIFRSAAGQILMRAKRENQWPVNGVIAS